LRRLLNDGSDLTMPMEIDFHIVVPDERAGKCVARSAADVGFKTVVVHDDDDGSWTCWCTKVMVPRYEDIVGVQRLLDDLGHPHGGYSDGWGSFGNAPEQ